MSRISLDAFINKYVGKSVGVPWNKALDGECVSMIQRYVNECFGEPLKVRGHAINYGNTLVRDGIAKRVTKPQYGDIIVWGSNMGGGYGHVAIYLNDKSIFDQNNTSVKPTRSSQVRPMIKTRPLQYIRMNKPLIKDMPKYQKEVYSFTATVDVINIRADHYTVSKIVGKLLKGETFNYVGKIEAGGYVWVTDGKDWLAVRTVRNGIRGPLWGTLQPQKKVEKPKEDYITLHKNVPTWRFYKLGVAPVVKNTYRQLKPRLFGGLTYKILDRPTKDLVTIKTKDYGVGNIWIGHGTEGKFTIVRK